MCAHCLRAQSTCICALVVPTPHATDVLILQHPLEVHHTKNTARLLHLSLPGSRLVVGEAFDAVQLHALVPPGHNAVLLYPPTPGDETNAGERPAIASKSPITLIVLDATWRKSRKMLHRSPALRNLPHLGLQDLPPSGYTIRKAHAVGQLSTLEATCSALAQLEGDAARFAPLLAAFTAFVGLRAAESVATNL
jgi:DTW domain-containing protein YfiP